MRALLMGLLLLLALPAIASAGWRATGSWPAAGPAALGGHEDDLVVAWPAPGGLVTASSASGGRRWRPAVKVPGTADAGIPSVAVGPDGRAAIGWGVSARGDEYEEDHAPGRVHVAVRARRGRPLVSSRDLGGAGFEQALDPPVLDISRRGRVLAVWQDGNGMVSQASGDGRGRWGKRRKLGESDGIEPPFAAYDDRGRAHVLWRSTSYYELPALWGTIPAARVPRPRRALVVPGPKTTEELDEVAVAMSPNGEQVAAWHTEEAGAEFARNGLRVAVRAPGARRFRPFRQLDVAGPAATVGPPGVAFAPDGWAHVAWTLPSRGRHLVKLATRPPGGRFGRPVVIARREPGTTGTVAIAAGRGGQAVVAWGGTARLRPVRAVRVRGGRRTGRIATLARRGRLPRVALVRGGGSVVLWSERERVRAARETGS